jgi:hypothetical protein
LRVAGVSCLVLMFSPAALEADQSGRSLEAISRGLQTPRQLTLEVPPVLSVPDESRRFGILTLTTPDFTRGEFVSVSLPVGEFTTRLARKISTARYHRRERKARETVERAVRELHAQQKAK